VIAETVNGKRWHVDYGNLQLRDTENERRVVLFRSRESLDKYLKVFAVKITDGTQGELPL
jgi:nucleosome binding factor SPN SPT16 subunit